MSPDASWILGTYYREGGPFGGDPDADIVGETLTFNSDGTVIGVDTWKTTSGTAPDPAPDTVSGRYILAGSALTVIWSQVEVDTGVAGPTTISLKGYGCECLYTRP